MSGHESRLDELLSLCERLDAEGKEVRADDVCDDAALLPELESRLEALRRFRALAEVSKTTTAPPLPVGETMPAPGRADNTPWPEGGPPAPDLAFLRPPESPGEMGRLGTFRVLGVLGRGGMGIVLHGQDPALGRDVAIKAMKPELAAFPEPRRRFQQEAQAAARIDHAHVAPIYQVDEARGVPYIVMPLLRGQTLSARLLELREKSARLSPLEAVRCARQMAEGLAAAHEKGIIHRDVKPANVWLKAPDGTAVLLDFGLARACECQQELTQVGAVVGTPSFMAPEQAAGEAVDARADLFSLGCVLYEMLTGERAFGGTCIMTILVKLAAHTPPAVAERVPGLPAELSELVGRLLAHAPEQRPPSAEDAACRLRRIEEVMANPAIASLPTLLTTEAAPPRRSSWLAWAIGAVALLLVGVVVAAASWRAGVPVDKGDQNTLAPLNGDMKALVWSSRARGAELGVSPIAVPVQSGDMVRVDVAFDHPAHVYIIWVDSSGGLIPLYPWNKGDDLITTAAGEVQSEAVQSAGTPHTITMGWRCDDNAGLETILALARRTPLPPGDSVAGLIGKLPANRYVSPTENTYQTFRDGKLIHERPKNWVSGPRGIKGKAATELEDAVLLAVKRLSPHFELIQAVRFAHVKREEGP
jgi:tRNA A-37 threonylcarbamoyl transferase component Bud32